MDRTDPPRQQRHYVRMQQPSRPTESHVFSSSHSMSGGILWQDHPKKILRYDPRTIHAFTFLPFTHFRALGATAFGSKGMWAHAAALVAIVATIQHTGLGYSTSDARQMITLFSSSALGTIGNISAHTIFFVALFVNTIIQKDNSAKNNYSRYNDACLDLVDAVCTHVVGPSHHQTHMCPAHEHKACCNTVYHAALPDHCRDHMCTVRRTLIRYINAAFIFLLSEVASSGLRRDGEQRLELMDCDFTLTKTNFWEQTFGIPPDSVTSQPCWWERAAPEKPPMQLEVLKRHLVTTGILTDGEWALVLAGRVSGVMMHQVILSWCTRLLVQACADGRVAGVSQSILLAKSALVRSTARQLVSTSRSQLPYSYVVLVTLMIHAYLLVFSVWSGFVLNCGLGEENDGEYQSASSFMTAVVYFCVALYCVVFCGILRLAVQTEDPWGTSPGNLPLRLNVDLLMASSVYHLKHVDHIAALLRRTTESGAAQQAQSTSQRAQCGSEPNQSSRMPPNVEGEDEIDDAPSFDPFNIVDGQSNSQY